MTMSEQPSHDENLILQELYPELSPEQLAEAAYYLKRYLDWVARVAARQRNLTDSDPTSSMSME